MIHISYNGIKEERRTNENTTLQHERYQTVLTIFKEKWTRKKLQIFRLLMKIIRACKLSEKISPSSSFCYSKKEEK